MKSSTYRSQFSLASAGRSTLAIGAFAALALAWSAQSAQAAYTFQNIINTADPTFNQALGINQAGEIAGYFGSGAAGHPNKGYTTTPPYTSFTNENFPLSVQTQVTGINNIGTTVGFWSNSNLGVGMDSNFGFTDVGGTFTDVNNPLTPATTPSFNQLLGVNDSNIAVGFYTDAAANNHGYTYNIATKTFSANIDDPNGTSTTAAAINNAGQIAGFYVGTDGNTHGFVDIGGTFITINAPGATDTSLLGLNDLGEAVGFDMTGAIMHGVVCSISSGACTEVDDPFGLGTTTLNGVNDKGQIVGFYVDSAGNTIGLLADPVPEPASLLLLAAGLIGMGAFARRRKAS